MPNNYPLQHAWHGRDRRDNRTTSCRNGGALDHRRMAGAPPARRRPALRGKDGRSMFAVINRPPVKSTDRPGVAPRKSRDGKGRAQSPHPACGRFEAAHCAAHLATIFVPRPPRSTLRDVFAMVCPIAGSPEPDRLNATHEAHPHHEIAPPRHSSRPTPCRLSTASPCLVLPRPPPPGGWTSPASAAR